MAKTVTGTTIPPAGTVAAPVKGVVSVPLAGGGTVSARVPAAASITINGVVSPLIDLRAASLATIVAFINAMGTGAKARVSPSGQLVIDNVTTIDGEPDLLTFLGLI